MKLYPDISHWPETVKTPLVERKTKPLGKRESIIDLSLNQLDRLLTFDLNQSALDVILLAKMSLNTDDDSNYNNSNDNSSNSNSNSITVNQATSNGCQWWSEAPSAPSPGLVLFNSEEQSDLIFIVTMDRDEDCLKFPGHSFIIKDSSPIFKEIIHQLDQRQRSSADPKPIINIQCRPETLHMLMSYIYKKEVILNSVTSCLALLELSVKFMLTELTSICLTFLCNNATEYNVLHILTTINKIEFKTFQSFTCNSTNSVMLKNNNQNNRDDNNDDNNNNTSNNNNNSQEGNVTSTKNSINCKNSEKRFKLENENSLTESSVENLVNELISRCYSILDENAEKILSSEAICTLNRELLVKILRRDTLNLSTELTAFSALERWSVCQCQRELREIGAQSRRDVLGDSVYTVRYLTMPLMVFMRGPWSSDILSEIDKNWLQSKLLDPDVTLPAYLSGLRLDVPRKFVKPVRSLRPYLPTKTPSTGNGFDRKKKPAIKKFLNGLGDVMIFAIRIFD